MHSYLRSVPSEPRAQASRDNGKNGGRPKRAASAADKGE